MEFIQRTQNIPPKKGLTKVQRALGTKQGATDNCPCAEVCKKLGTYKPGACFLGTADTHKCIVANNLLLAKTSPLK
jgi:hypothetical protein